VHPRIEDFIGPAAASQRPPFLLCSIPPNRSRAPGKSGARVEAKKREEVTPDGRRGAIRARVRELAKGLAAQDFRLEVDAKTARPREQSESKSQKGPVFRALRSLSTGRRLDRPSTPPAAPRGTGASPRLRLRSSR
jgi:hypothetical protein